MLLIKHFTTYKEIFVRGCLEKLENNIFRPYTDIGLILRIEASSNNHPAKVPEAVLPPHNEERLIKVRMIFSQFLLLDFSDQPNRHRDGTYTSYYKGINETGLHIAFFWSKTYFTG